MATIALNATTTICSERRGSQKYTAVCSYTSSAEKYRDLRREETRLHARKKREAERRELDDIVTNCSRDEALELYEKIKLLAEISTQIW